MDSQYHLLSKCGCTLNLLGFLLEDPLIKDALISNAIILHKDINSIKKSINSRTKKIIIDTYGFNSFEVNDVFINTKLRYAASVVLICEDRFKSCFIPFMHDDIIYKA
ncbi:TPA: hypothetical protein ACHJX8_004410 [Yersinia enterocolitica]